MCYMYYVDHRDLGRVLDVLCGPQRLGSCVTCIMWTTETWGRVLHVLCGPQRLGSCVTCIMWTTETWVVCYMYYADHIDLSRVLHVLCGPQGTESCITCIM